MDENLLDIVHSIKELLEPLVDLDPKDLTNHRNIEFGIRNHVRKALVRKDLRLSTEMLFNDLLGEFVGFDSYDMENRKDIVDSAMRKLSKLEYLLDAGKAISEERTKLPPPPDAVAKMMEEEKRKIDIEDENQRRERNRRNERRFEPAADKPIQSSSPENQTEQQQERNQSFWRKRRRRPGKPPHQPGAQPQQSASNPGNANAAAPSGSGDRNANRPPDNNPKKNRRWRRPNNPNQGA